jgi:hypothetical protein
MQDTIRVGDTLDFTTTLADYPASAGWVLTYRLIPRASGTAITITGTASGDDHRTSATATTSATWTAGEYSWAAYVALADERYTVDTGVVTLTPNLATATAHDNRSQAQTALEEAKAAFATFQSTGGRVRSYSIAGRSMEYADEAALLKAISYWQIQVKIEEAANRRKLGLDDGRRIYLRAGNA